ncbi:MAG TPA: sensor histidine kinase [Intrasporangiaceae bacterium]|nr:sensor histidine kinase [Intrasporangiaceae bacterium]
MRSAPDPEPDRWSFPGWVNETFGADDPWVRPRPQIERRDVVLAAVVALIGLVSLELYRNLGALADTRPPTWVQWLAVLSGAALLVGRRRWPLIIALVMATHMIATGVTMPMVMTQFTLQAAYFVAFLSAVAWAQDRKAMIIVMDVIIVVMFVWVALQFAVGNSMSEFVPDDLVPGPIPPLVAMVLLSAIINAIYFGGAVAGGLMLWREARQKALLRQQAETIADQAEDLRDQAITEERLRIARELHDVVAHHVSVIGVQAAAARRVLDRNPVAATEALGTIESSSRDAVTSMRGLLGTLRGIESVADEQDSRAPQPSLDQLPDLVAGHETPNRSVAYTLVESTPGAVESVPAPIAHSIYRTAQEALTNIEKHSTATRVTVTVRVEADAATRYAEIEVVDNGRPRGDGGLSSGLGQLGIRERAASHRATVDIGPRASGGYRVRVRYPLGVRKNEVA